MAERKFDYVNVSNIYKEMQNITGDSSSPDSIAGILSDVNKEVANKVEVENEAVYGELGRQLQLDWNNTSSSFNEFINNFNNWSTLIAQSAGKYAEFEEKVNGLKINNPLGMTSNGITTAYTNTSNYVNYTKDVYDYLSSLTSGELYEFTGAQYIDTNMVEREKNRKIMAGVNFGLQAVSTVLSIVGGAGIVSAEMQAGKTILGGAGEVATNALPATSSASASTQPALESGNMLALPENSSATVASKASTQWAIVDEAGNVTAYGPGVTNAAGMADDFASAASKGATGMADDIASTASKTIEMTSTVDTNGNIIASASKPSFGSRFTGAFKNVGNTVANSKIGQTVANSKVGQAVSTKFSSALNSVKGFGSKVSGGVTSAGGVIKNGATALGNNIKTGAEVTASVIKNNGVDIVKEVVTNPYVDGVVVAQGTSAILNATQQ